MTAVLPRDMYDAIPSLVGNIPTDAFAVAGYVDSISFTWPQSAWDRFPNSIKSTITTTGRVRAHWADCENGDLTPLQAYDLYQSGGCRGIYCNYATWQAVQDVFIANHKPQCPYWIAQYPGGGRVLPVLNGIEAVAHQYQSTPGYDLSCLTSAFLSIIGASMTDFTSPGDPRTPDGKTWAATFGQPISYGSELDAVLEALLLGSQQGPTWPAGPGVLQRLEDLKNAVAAVDTQLSTIATLMGSEQNAVMNALDSEQAALSAAIAAEGTPQVTQAQLQAALAALDLGPATAQALSAFWAKAAGTTP